MTRRLWCVLVQAGLCATALPACAPLGGFLHSETGRGDAHLADNQRPANPPGQGGLYPDMEEAEVAVSAPQRPGEDLQLQYALLLTGQKPPFVPKQGWGVKDYSDPPPVLPPVGPPLLQMPDGTAEPLDFGSKHEVRGPPAPPPEDLAAALNCLLRKQHAAALAYLDRFDKGNQEVFLSLLSALAVLNDKRLDQLTPEEAAALEEQFEGLVASLRNRCGLVIDKMCLCEHIGGYGQYTPLRPGHAFQAGTLRYAGERVQIYVELRNLASERRGDYYLTALNGTVLIHDGRGQEVWKYNYRGKEKPLPSLMPRSDCHQVYDFSVPVMPPGRYTLTLEVADETRQPARTARKSVEFVVAPAAP